MSEVTVPFGDTPSDTAILLLAAADKLDDYTEADVRTVEGAFVVPKEVADKAGVDYESDEQEAEAEPPPAAKKTAKKSK